MGIILAGMTDTRGWKRKYAGMPEPLVIEVAPAPGPPYGNR